MNMRTLTLTLCLIMLGATFVHGQTKRQFIQAAEDAWAEKNYYSALIYYKTVADAWPEDTEVQYRTAEAARHYHSYLLAEKYYQVVLDQDSVRAWPEARLHLAGIKRNLGKYGEAISLYQEYDQIRADKTQNCARHIEACQYAIVASRMQLPMELVPVGVNTEFADFAPVRIGDTLYYSSMNVPLDDPEAVSQSLVTRIYESSNDIIGKQLRAEMQQGNHHIAHVSYNADQSRMFFSICHNINQSEYRCELYAAKREGGTWMTSEKLPDRINQPGYTATQPAFARYADGREGLFYASDVPGGKGKMDIWFAQLDETGRFMDPVNLASINTPENDITPYYHHPSQRLFFSSEGYPNLGGYDIYESRISGSTWSSPAALPIPFNSSYNDLYFSMTDDGSYLYLASNRESPGAKYIDAELQSCCNDIFRARYTKEISLLARVFRQPDGAPLPGATVTLERKNGLVWEKVEAKSDPGTHEQTFVLHPGQEYRVIGTKEWHEPDTASFNTFTWEQPDPITKDLFLRPSDVLVDVYTFDALSRQPLASSKVQLYDVTDPAKPVLVDEAERTGTNEFTFRVRPGKMYEVRGSSDGYQDETAQIDTRDAKPDSRLRQDLYLKYKSLVQYIPLSVYFDNDVPGRRQRSETTRINYQETLPPYLERESEYVDIYTSVLTEQEQAVIRGRIRDFFQEKVRKGMRELDNFCEALLRDLQHGRKVEVTIEGYTSPRAEEYYNRKLGSRRASSVQNYIEGFRDGVFSSYIQSGQLVFKPVTWGETQAPEGISDDLDDERQSIYSVEAAQERRADIKHVKVIPNN